MTKYDIGISRHIVYAVFHFISRSFGVGINAPFFLEVTTIEDIGSAQYHNGNYHHHNTTHVFFLLFLTHSENMNDFPVA